MHRASVYTIVSPDLVQFDVTDRVKKVGSISKSVEDDLTVLTHGDVTVEIGDSDGWATAIFDGIDPNDEWRFLVDVEVTERGRVRMERIFTGILDLPWSIAFDENEKTAAITALAISKKLDAVSAETLCRTVSGVTGTVSAASYVVTVSDSSDLAAGDLISLQSESHWIESVDSATQVTTEDPWESSYTAVQLVLETRWLRDQEPGALANSIAALAEMTCSADLNAPADSLQVPFPTSLNTAGLPGSIPNSVTTVGGDISVYASANRYDADSETSGFVLDGVETPKADWTPYVESEPTLRALGTGARDDGSRAWNYDTGDYYTLDLLGTLRKNGVTIGSPVFTGTAYRTWIEYDEVNDRVWVSWAVATAPEVGIKIYNTTGSLLQTISLTRFGPLRFSIARQSMFVARWNYSGGYVYRDRLEEYDISTGTPALAMVYDAPFAIGVARSLASTPELILGDHLNAWTLRVVNSSFVCCCYNGLTGGGQMFVWSATSGSLVGSFNGAGSLSFYDPVATVFNAGGVQDDVYICWLRSYWYVVSATFAGVIEYANFDGLSAGAALKELAIATCSHLRVDAYGSITMMGRQFAIGDARKTLEDPPLKLTRLPLWEAYRTSVLVSGETVRGETVEVLAGESGNSSRRLELDSQLITNDGMAAGAASMYSSYFSRKRKEYDGTWKTTEPFLDPCDVVKFRDEEWLVLSVEIDLERETERLKLVSVEA